MALTLPKIVYPSGGANTLNFARPPRFVPFDKRNAARYDHVSSAGVVESVYQRTDLFLQFTMEYVGAGSDVTAWQSFIANAEQGNAFDYYPDASSGTNSKYRLVATDWTPKYKQLGQYTFDMLFRKDVGWP